METIMKKLAIIFPAILIISLSAFSAPVEKMRMAVMDFRPDGVSKSLTRKKSELIRGEMINTGKFIVIERSQIGQILKEQGFRTSGCSDTSCAVKVGKMLSANKILNRSLNFHKIKY